MNIKRKKVTPELFSRKLLLLFNLEKQLRLCPKHKQHCLHMSPSFKTVMSAGILVYLNDFEVKAYIPELSPSNTDFV